MSDIKPPLTPAQLASAIRTAMDRGATPGEANAGLTP